jgi:hypothetical protein
MFEGMVMPLIAATAAVSSGADTTAPEVSLKIGLTLHTSPEGILPVILARITSAILLLFRSVFSTRIRVTVSNKERPCRRADA